MEITTSDWDFRVSNRERVYCIVLCIDGGNNNNGADQGNYKEKFHQGY